MKGLIYTSGSIIEVKQTGGVKRFIELSKALCNKYDFDLCCSDNNESLKKYNLKSKYEMKKIKSRFKILPPELLILIKNFKVIKKIKKEKYDRIIVFDVPPTIGLCLFNVKNIVLMIRKDMIGYEEVNSNNTKKLSYKLKKMYQWISEDICIKKCSKIICQCEYDKEIILKRHNRLRKSIGKKFKIQINNINPSWIVEKSKVNSEFIVDDSKKNICFIGGFNDKRKGQDILLEAIKELNKEKNNYNFYLIGGGKNLENYKKIYNYKNVEFLGNMDNPLIVLKKCDLLVVPSLADSCPNTVLEALYNDIVVIGSNAGGIPEILCDESAIFDLNKDSLILKIKDIMNDNKTYEMIKKNQNIIKKELTFDWTLKIYDIIKE